MPRKKKTAPLTFVEKITKIKKAGINNINPIDRHQPDFDEPEPLDHRIQKILQLSQHKAKSNNMLYFIMYDIEDNKVRNEIFKFLKDKGCFHIQKSIFLANSSRQQFAEIHQALKDINSMYDNNDSILMVPISTDELSAMKIIGLNIDLDLILENRTTLFF